MGMVGGEWRGRCAESYGILKFPTMQYENLLELPRYMTNLANSWYDSGQLASRVCFQD